MDQASNIRQGEALDWATLEAYLRAEMPDLKGTMTYAQFLGGHANLTYLLKFGEQEFVLRRPPFGKIAPGAHDMKREYRVLSKLYNHFPQAPRAFLLCEDETVVGAKFVLMERRTGVVMRYELLDCFKNKTHAEERLSDALVRAQANLHKVDIEAADLGDLGRPEGFAERQVEGWKQRWDLAKTEENPNMDFVYETLSADIPKPQAVSVLHNDWKFDNCQFQPDNPDQVTAVFDWDMATLGDPLVDFGSALGYWPDARLEKLYLPIKLKGAFPDKQFLIEKYASYTGFSMENIAWYEALAYWKAAVILQQLYVRYVRGNSSDARMAKMGLAAQACGAAAALVLR